ncbi:hypothetical protein BG004_003052 [Podila humilis]|nr:hypothetical protein BG004_003052 [Podila humilis]
MLPGMKYLSADTIARKPINEEGVEVFDIFGEDENEDDYPYLLDGEWRGPCDRPMFKDLTYTLSSGFKEWRPYFDFTKRFALKPLNDRTWRILSLGDLGTWFDHQLDTYLESAVASNDLAMVQELCRTNHDPNQTFACSPRQSAYAVQPIVGQAENFEPDDILYGATPLNLAVLNGNEDIVRVLIDAGADLNKKDGRGRSALLCAVYGLDTLTITPANLALISQTSPAHLSIIRNCILPHPSITLSTLNAPQDEIKGITPLCLASYLGKEVVVKCLLEAGKVDVDATDRKGATALMYAVKTLLRHGASPDQTDSNGWSSIQYGQMYPEIVQMFEEALRCKRPEVLHLLTPPESPQPRSAASTLDRAADGSSNTALPHALSQSLVRYPLYYSKLSSLLSSLPAAQTISSKDGALTLQPSTSPSPNSGSAANGRKSSSEVALAQQIQRTTHTALLEAIKLGDYMSLQSLLMAPPVLNDTAGSVSSGPNVALVNHHDPQTGLTPLHHALRTRPLPSMETVKILYQAGADMNAQSHYGRTALHHLCRFSLEHALAPITDENTLVSNAVAAATAAPSTPTGVVIEEYKPSRRKHRHRTETSGSAGSNHLTPMGKELPSSSAASTTSSNDLSTGPRHPHGTLIDTGAVKSASPEEIQRASQHLAACCRLLLRLGSLVNIADRHGNTPLHFAVEYGGVLEVVSVLVKEGADNEQRNTKGLKPLDVVRGEQSEEMRRILESGRSKSSGDGPDDGKTDSKAVVPAYHARDSILKPLNLPETLHEVDFQFNQVLQNLEHYQNHTSVSIETSLQYITDQILLGWSPENQGANGYGQSQEEYNADLVSSLENLKYELESTYELLMITEEQYRDVITFYETELDEMTRQNLTVLTAYDSEKSKVTGLYSVYTRLIEQLEELEAENEGLKTELEEKKRRGLVSLGRLVNGAMGGQWSGSRNGTSISLAKRKAAMIKKNADSLMTTALDEEHIGEGQDDDALASLPRPSMVLMSQDMLSSNTSGGASATGSHPLVLNHEGSVTFGGLDERELTIPRPTSPTQTIISSSEQEPAFHSIAVLSQKVSLLEQELSSKTCDIKERDLLVGELSELIEEQSRTFEDEIKHRGERIESLEKIIGRAEGGENVQTLVDELAVRMIVQEDEQLKKQRIQSGIAPSLSACGDSASGRVSGDWTFLLKATGASKKTLKSGQNEELMVETLKQELQMSRTQTARLELANTSLKERWQQAMHELEAVRKSEAQSEQEQQQNKHKQQQQQQQQKKHHLKGDAGLGGSSNANVVGTDVESLASTMISSQKDPRVTRFFVPKQAGHIQDEPLLFSLDENGQPQEEFPSLEEIEMVFEILMANLAEISRDAEEADQRLLECNKAKEQIYQKCLFLDSLQKSLDENVDKIVSQPVKAGDSPPNFMQDQLKLQTQLNQLMDQAESVTALYDKLKKDLQDYKSEKQGRLRELDQVRDLMRKIGPQELLRGLLVKLDSDQQPNDAAAQARREAIATAVAQGMELAAELAGDDDNNNGNETRANSQHWRNSCSVVDEGDMQDAIDSRLETASIDYYTQSCSISDHKLFIQSLCSTLYALQMTTTHQIVSLKTSLAESRASLALADQELSNLNDQIAGLYDEVGTLRNQLRGLQQELDRLIQHRKAEVEKVWEIVGEVKITSGGALNRLDDDDECSVSSADTKELNRKSSIQSRALASSSRYTAAAAGQGTSATAATEGSGDSTTQVASTTIPGEKTRDMTGESDSIVARSLSISRAERASALRRISSPQTLSENDEYTSGSHPPSRTSHDFSDPGSELDRHALISAEMDKLRSVHLHLLSTITEYKKQISVVKDRNLKLVATLLDRERVRLWTADGQDEVISAIVGQHGGNNLHNLGPHSTRHNVHNHQPYHRHQQQQQHNYHQHLGSTANASSSVGAISLGGDGSSTALTGSSSSLTGLGALGLSSSLNPGIASGAKKHHHLSLTAAEDGIKLLRCQLERIRQSEMTRFTEMGIGLTMNYASLYNPAGSGAPSVAESVTGGGAAVDSLTATKGGGSQTLAGRGGSKKVTLGNIGAGASTGGKTAVNLEAGVTPGAKVKSGEGKGEEAAFTKFEATLYSDEF